jgi:hypothetical protein
MRQLAACLLVGPRHRPGAALRCTPWNSDSVRVPTRCARQRELPTRRRWPCSLRPRCVVLRMRCVVLRMRSHRTSDLDERETSTQSTAAHVRDGAVLLKQTALVYAGPTVPGTRPGSVSATVKARTPGEKVHGPGEHRTGTVQQRPYPKICRQPGLWAEPWRGRFDPVVRKIGYGFV